MEEMNLDYTGEVVKEIEIDQEFAKEQARKRKIQAIWDKVTTALFIALLASPIAILFYIFHWFVNVS